MSARTSFTERTPSMGRQSYCDSENSWPSPMNFSFIVSMSATWTSFMDCIWAAAPPEKVETRTSGTTTKRPKVLNMLVQELEVNGGPAISAVRSRVATGRRRVVASSAIGKRLQPPAHLIASVVVGWVLLRFGAKWGGTDWGIYRTDLVANTD